MTGFSVALFVTLVSLAIVQALVTLAFFRALWRFRAAQPGAEFCPKAAIVLCLRGRDPFLEKCLEAILHQDYPDYQLRIVVDNRQDPAWQIAEALVARYGAARVHIETLGRRHGTCSLKCSAVTQALEGLDDSVEVAALVDADTLTHPSWLRELVAPLKDERVAVATGNRWYMPENSSWGAMVRYLWNAAAVVQMFWDGVCWGGTLAIKRKEIITPELLDRWRHAFCEDTMLFRWLRKRRLRVKFVPSLMIVNREDSHLLPCLSWMRRQLVNMRLYHPFWPLVLLHGLGTTLVLAAAVAAMAVSALRGNWSALLWCLLGLAAYEAIMLSLLVPMEMLVRRIVRCRGASTGWLSPKTVLRLLPGIALTQIVYTLALVGAQFARVLDWRGVHYRVRGPWNIERLDDPPSDAVAPCAAEGHSL